MSTEKIERIIEAMRHERYRFTPVRRVYIPKKNGKMRPLGLPTWSDKLVGEVVRLLLEAYYEPQFSDRSHGFRPGRGCHTALREVQRHLDRDHLVHRGRHLRLLRVLDHEIMVRILAEKIHDNRFLRLIRNMLKAGYLEDWKYHETLSGCPQGGVVSPILSNIYLHKLDEFVETVLIPEYTRGSVRKRNPEYPRVNEQTGIARASAGTGPRPGNCGSSCAASPSGPARPRLPAAALLPLRRRSPPGVHRAEGRSRGDQGPAGGVPARRPRAGTQRRTRR